MPFDFSNFISAFVTLFVIMDPFVSLPVLLSLSQKSSSAKRASLANYATIIAGVVLLIFFIFSTKLLDILGISFGSFMVGGGLILLIMGVENVLGISFEQSKKCKDMHAAAVVIGTPLLTGPGTITSVIILTEHFGHLITGLASIAALFVTWIILRQADRLYKLVGERVIAIFSRVMGLLLSAIGIEIMVGGVRRLITGM